MIDLVLAAVLAAGAAQLAAEPPTSTVAGIAPVQGNANLLASGIPEIPGDLRARVGQYLNARAASLLDVAEDGSAALIATRFANTLQLHLVEQPMGARQQLTFGEEPILRARFRPGDARSIYYLQDVGGGEQYQLFRLDRRTGRSERLTDGKGRHEQFKLSYDGRLVAYSGTSRNGKDTDVYVAELDRPGSARLLVQASGTMVPVDFSPDGRRLLVQQERSIADADLRVVEVATGEVRQLTPSQGRGACATPPSRPTGRASFT